MSPDPPRDFELAPEEPSSGPGPARPPAPASPRGDRPARQGPRGRPPKKTNWKLVLLLSVVPVGVAVFWFTRSAEAQRKFLEQFPPGAGRRVLLAVVAFVLMFVLAKAMLPLARIAVLSLSRVGGRFRGLPPGKRILWLPVRALVEFAWLLAQVFFALVSVGILLTGIASLLYVVEIAKPGLFPLLPGSE